MSTETIKSLHNKLERAARALIRSSSVPLNGARGAVPRKKLMRLVTVINRINAHRANF